MKILVVDDDPRLRDLVRTALERADHSVTCAADGAQALVEAARSGPDLIVLDIGLPEMDGFEVCRRIRARSEVPILFLTARDDEVDRIVGLEMGADDYVTKPFSPRELVARVGAILRRSGSAARSEIRRHGRVTLDMTARVCRVDEATVALTGTEFQMLEAVMASPGRLLSRMDMANAVWGSGAQQSDRTMDSHLRNLRRKLAEAGCPESIETVHGQGIRLGACS
ncbi:response regulator transcription factor [Sagittula sp. S175]|uniref:response regulator transcription factor n=1 Tax=Sagittula sp. S175 TaxID=3415129 RepID=UPI003C79FD34